MLSRWLTSNTAARLADPSTCTSCFAGGQRRRSVRGCRTPVPSKPSIMPTESHHGHRSRRCRSAALVSPAIRHSRPARSKRCGQPMLVRHRDRDSHAVVLWGVVDPQVDGRYRPRHAGVATPWSSRQRSTTSSTTSEVRPAMSAMGRHPRSFHTATRQPVPVGITRTPTPPSKAAEQFAELRDEVHAEGVGECSAVRHDVTHYASRILAG